MAFRRTKFVLLGLVALAAAAGLALWVVKPRVAELLVAGDARQLRPEREGPPPPETAARPDLLVLAIDGIDRDLLYDLLRKGELPGLAALLGGRGEDGSFPHAHFEPDLLSVLPSTTIAAWASTFTGVPPGVHGVTGNEFFVREDRAMPAPAAVSIQDVSPILAVYTDDAADRYLEHPTVYEQLRADEPAIRIWVAMSQFFRGADRLILASRTAIGGAFEAFFRVVTADEDVRPLFAQMDEEVIETVVDELEHRPPPDVLTVYLPGADLFSHRAPEGPDEARRGYLREALDPRLERLRRELEKRDALADRFVVVISDHGHTDVVEDARHALGLDAGSDPPAALVGAGYRVRPFEWKVPEDTPFDAVLAYQGAMAYVYLADRSTCAAGPCDWSRPPRFEEDVLPAAEAFLDATRDPDGAAPPAGVSAVRALRGTLDLVLTRRPRPPGELDEPFQVYLGDGRLEDVESFLARNPRPEYTEFANRLRLLGAGPRGERAGDVLLVARNHPGLPVEERYYFSAEYRSWHGSAAPKDSEIPLIVAHPRVGAEALGTLTAEGLGSSRLQTGVADVLRRLRRGEPRPAP